MSNGLGTHGPRAEPVVYRWADGSEVLLTPLFRSDLRRMAQGSWSDSANQNILVFGFRVNWSDRYSRSIEFEISSKQGRPVLYIKTGMEFIEIDQPKLRGFILDLGIDRFFDTHTGLVATHIGLRPSMIWYPRFVRNEDWNNRYEEAEKFFVENFDERQFSAKNSIFIVNHLKFRKPRDPRADRRRWWKQTTWTYSWYNNGNQIEREAASLEQAVDDILQTESILPESAKEGWDKENVERGVFVLPTPEEVEVFRILDEPLPFFLPWADVEAWLRASQVWP